MTPRFTIVINAILRHHPAGTLLANKAKYFATTGKVFFGESTAPGFGSYDIANGGLEQWCVVQ